MFKSTNIIDKDHKMSYYPFRKIVFIYNIYIPQFQGFLDWQRAWYPAKHSQFGKPGSLFLKTQEFPRLLPWNTNHLLRLFSHFSKSGCLDLQVER
ncbi:MAG: hypothetical protein AUJ34_03505 [Parcubacteria group bacterium CG1_02_41_12]|nr:MAG: hypothetical protein AUJ34_03505 [Parcubacteria group bacterium CG1_02_41_12]